MPRCLNASVSYTEAARFILTSNSSWREEVFPQGGNKGHLPGGFGRGRGLGATDGGETPLWHFLGCGLYTGALESRCLQVTWFFRLPPGKAAAPPCSPSPALSAQRGRCGLETHARASHSARCSRDVSLGSVRAWFEGVHSSKVIL